MEDWKKVKEELVEDSKTHEVFVGQRIAKGLAAAERKLRMLMFEHSKVAHRQCVLKMTEASKVTDGVCGTKIDDMWPEDAWVIANELIRHLGAAGFITHLEKDGESLSLLVDW